MEKIAAPLNTIEDFLMQNHDHKYESTIRECSISAPENVQEISQADAVIHTVEDCQKVRDKYPFEISIRNEWHILSQSRKKYWWF